MSKHPYPQKIVDEIADYLKPYTASRIEAGSLAHQVLRRIWDASRVDDVDLLPDDAVYLNDLGGIGFVGSARDTCEVDRMEHVLHWGDSDE